MLSVEQARIIDPNLNNLSDEEVLTIMRNIYEIGSLAFDKWNQDKRFQKSHLVLRQEK